MCKECYGGERDKERYKKELVSLVHDNIYVKYEIFESFNTTSIEHLWISMYSDDNEIRGLSYKLLQEFLKWYELNKPDSYAPTHGLCYMYSKKMIADIVDGYNINSTSDDIQTFISECVKDFETVGCFTKPKILGMNEFKYGLLRQLITEYKNAFLYGDYQTKIKYIIYSMLYAGIILFIIGQINWMRNSLRNK